MMEGGGKGLNIYALHVREAQGWHGTPRHLSLLKADRCKRMPNKLLIAAFLDNRQACLCRHFIVQTAPERVNSASPVGSRHFDRPAIALSKGKVGTAGIPSHRLSSPLLPICIQRQFPSTRVEELLTSKESEKWQPVKYCFAWLTAGETCQEKKKQKKKNKKQKTKSKKQNIYIYKIQKKKGPRKKWAQLGWSGKIR